MALIITKRQGSCPGTWRKEGLSYTNGKHPSSHTSSRRLPNNLVLNYQALASDLNHLRMPGSQNAYTLLSRDTHSRLVGMFQYSSHSGMYIDERWTSSQAIGVPFHPSWTPCHHNIPTICLSIWEGRAVVSVRVTILLLIPGTSSLEKGRRKYLKQTVEESSQDGSCLSQYVSVSVLSSLDIFCLGLVTLTTETRW